MARQPEVFARELDPVEAQRLVKITRTARHRVRLRRAGIVLASVQGRTPTEAAAMFAARPSYAREVIHAFCAMRRSVISLAQRGEMGGISLDLMANPAPKGNIGDSSMPGN